MGQSKHCARASKARRKNEEIAGKGVHLILNQHNVVHWCWAHSPARCYHSQLGCCLDSDTAAHISCRVAAQGWRSFPGESGNAAFLNAPDPASLTVIGNLSSSLSYYTSPLGDPTDPWDYFTRRRPPLWDLKHSRPHGNGYLCLSEHNGPS